MKKRVILIDPGHGAETPGKRSPDGTLREYEFNRDVARRLKAKLTTCGLESRLTVDTDWDMPLRQRTNQARDLKRNGYDVLLVSIHANAFGAGWGTACGIETYTNDQAERLAAIIQRRLVTETGRRDRGVKRANLHITRESGRYGIPGVLVELGFMTNRDECALLKTSAYREKCALAIAKAICEWIGVQYRECARNPQQEQRVVDNPVDNTCGIELNGKLLAVRGILQDGKSLLPVRAVAEAAGKGDLVGWCESSRKVLLAGKVLDSSVVIDGTGYAWSREVATALGLSVEWDEKTRTVKMNGEC